MDQSYLDGHTPHDLVTTLRKDDKPKFVSKVILDLLDAYKSTGLTIAQLVELTGFRRDTIAKHLEVLETSRQVYRVQGNAGIFHKNGRVVHYRSMEHSMFDRRFYTFYYLNNPEGDFVYIQEKEIGRFKSVKVKGGIMVSVNDFKRFMNELSKFTEEVLNAEKKLTD